jgi:hypothetical protein
VYLPVLTTPMTDIPRAVRRAFQLLSLTTLALTSACAPRAKGIPFLPPSRPAEFSLAAIPWGIRGDSVQTLMEPRGYNFNSVDSDGDLVFDGMLMRMPTRVYGFMAEERLVKFRVAMMTPDEDAIPTYERARAELAKRYGAPKETIEEYDAPYRKGDGRAQEAVAKGKATMRSHWIVGQGARQQHVAIAVTDRLTVMIDYDGPNWERESVRRRRGTETRASR